MTAEPPVMFTERRGERPRLQVQCSEAGTMCWRTTCLNFSQIAAEAT